jgi:hypothetical protein
VTFLLIAVLGEQDFWIVGFASEAACAAQALMMELDWWACVPISNN